MTSMTVPERQTPIDPTTVPGWGVDADPDNDPTWPMRDRSHDDGPGMNWRRPPEQPETVEVLQSIEYNHRPAVFGTASPPSGLSGMIRRLAFKFSESRWTHWLLLMGADRVNVLEGVVADIGRGKIPNLFSEFGFNAEWKYDRRAGVRRAATVVGLSSAVIGAAWLLMRSRRAETIE